MDLVMLGGRNLACRLRRYNRRMSFIKSEEIVKKKLDFCFEKVVLGISPTLSKGYLGKEPISIRRLERKILHLCSNKSVIFLSSAAVYGMAKKEVCFKEDAPLNGVSGYAKEKLLFENSLLKNRKNFKSLHILRIAGIYDDLSDNLSSNLINRLNILLQNKSGTPLNISFQGKQKETCSVTFLAKL